MAKEPKSGTVLGDLLIDLDRLTYEELLKVAEAASAMAASKKEEAKAALKAEFEARAATLGMTLVEVTPRRGRGAGKKSAAQATSPKTVAYQDTNGNTWSGKGPRPKWLKEALELGKPLAEFKLV